MHITKKEFREHFLAYIPNLQKEISNKEKVQIYVETHKTDKQLKKLIHSSISDNSYSFKIINKPRKGAFKFEVTVKELTSDESSSVETKSIPMSPIGGSAISRIIMAAKDVSGRTSTLIYNVDLQKVITDFKVRLCLSTPQGNKNCETFEDTIVLEKKNCFSPRLLRDNGQTIKVSSYPIPRIEKMCLEEKKKNLKDMMYVSIADSVSNKLMQFKNVQ